MRWFESARAVIERWQTMRELRGLEKRERQDSYWAFKHMITEANEVFERDLRSRAIEIWQRAYAQFPDAAIKSEPALDLLIKMKLFDDAEALLQRGRKQFPHEVRILEGLAQVALGRGDREEALRRCDAVWKRAPTSVKGHRVAAAALSELGRAEEAESLLSRALAAMPDDASLRIEYARLADRSGNWVAALQRWSDVLEICGHLAGAVGMGASLTKLGRYDEADEVLSSVLYKAGNQIAIWIEMAQVAEQRQDLAEAVKRWKAVCQRFPLNPIGYLRGLRCLVETGARDEADAMLRDGVDRLPGEPALLIEYARLAHQSGNWTEAAARWSKVRDRFPAQGEGYARGAEALEALGQRAEADRVRLSSTALLAERSLASG